LVPALSGGGCGSTDPDRTFIRLENRFKGQERLAEKISKAMSERSRTDVR
jgi:hypothetical protein